MVSTPFSTCSSIEWAHHAERIAIHDVRGAPHDRVAIEVDVLERDEVEERIEGVEERLDLAAQEDRGKVLGPPGALQSFQGGHFRAENALVEEDDGAECLILRRRCDASPTARWGAGQAAWNSAQPMMD